MRQVKSTKQRKIQYVERNKKANRNTFLMLKIAKPKDNSLKQDPKKCSKEV